mmetsp:Transcript_12181/g.22825  ORF Transcript_12181/g.22825 Transcript_12181/m.22825 type:complete len:637 (+) Transcript_12181:181-2091(+)|eukprot:CAMPEP_0176498070 /NCGR_PEP_ID=MMETSP0200_2-20121128/12101_1 /TAXON_ID=947934 /ORGANISM="Chaetoceros sp., Strain GSL56" /LENGTH=636 /DNA_ID=CAMNT_0017896205 /DNA_START=108 /DNA_END=2018 /DNA_ORIENTATION=+
MTEAFDSTAILNAKYILGVVGTLVCSFAIIKVLFNIELHQFKRSMAPEVENNLSELTLSSSHSDDDGDSESVNRFSSSRNKSVIKMSLSRESNPSRDSYTGKKKLHKETRLGIFFNVALLTLLNYLLLVYLPGGAIPSMIGMTLLSCILLRSQFLEDLRLRRFDRISSVFTLMIFMASFLSLCTYASIGKKEGGIYEGPARIVGYDVTNYNNDNQSAVRTDLEVEWGGYWGCPDTPNKNCRAYVSGALCEVNENRKLEMTETYYKKLMEYQKEFVQEEKDAVKEVAEENDLEYVEVLQGTQDILQDESNVTEIEIESIENNITKTTKEIAEDMIDDGHGTNTSITEDKEAVDISTLEKEIAELEKKIQELEEENIEEEEMGEITEGAAEYYAEIAQEAVNETEVKQEENEDLVKDLDYYSEVVEELEEENETLEDENQDAAEENEILHEEVDEIIDEKGKGANESKTEEENYDYESEEIVNVNNNTDGESQYVPYIDDFGAATGGSLFGYSFDDDFFEDTYWAYDWDSAWGEYACSDLFDTDLEGLSYEKDLPPGDDEWPYVNIFGSCNSCKAFLVDYYSTEHFERIRQYQKQALTYMSYGMVGLLITGILTLKQWLKPAEENQIDLLMNYGRGFV